MIPQITEIGFPSYATLNSATVTLAEMGDRTITTQVKIDGDIVPDFSGWELEFKGERFVLPTKEPQAAKDTSSRRSIIDLTFSSWAVNELKRYFFVEMTSITSGTAIADKYKASLGLNLENFVTAFNNVLDYYFNGQIYMDLFGAGTGIYSQEPSFVEIDYTHIWDVLQKVYEIYDVRWTFAYDSVNQRYLIKVGYPAAEIDDHDFEYGYSGGLLRFERQVQDYDITNLLLGRGGEKNLPYRYFKKTDPQNPEWAADPDAIPELTNIYFENLRDINFRRYVQGWKTNPNRILEEGDSVETYDTERAATDWAYAKGHTDDRFNPVEYVKDDASIALYGERWGALENNDDIFPTIQGIEVSPFGRIDQVVDVEPVTTDDIEAMAADAAEITNVQGASKTEWINYNSRITVEINGPDFTVPANKVGNLTMVGTWLDSLQYGKRNNHQETIAADSAVRSLVSVDTTNSYVVAVSNSNAHEYPISGLAPGSYHYKMHIEVKAEFEQTMYDSVSVTVGADSFKLTTSEGTANAWKPTFDIWVKNIWNTTQASGESDTAYAARVWEPILGDRTGKEAAVAFSTGFLSISEDYNFVIASIPVVDRTKTINGVSSEWRITLIKSDAEYEATGKYIPNADTGGNASAGDYFFFTGIDMPHAYVLWAEERLNAYKETELAKLKQINPTWIIQIDKVRANTKEQGELEFLADRFASGAKLRVKDKRFTNNNVLTLYVQTITYTWQQPSQGKPYLVPDIEVVLSDKVAAVESPIDRLEGSVDMIQTSYAKISDIESVVRRVASPIFLKKTGESERSLSPTRFSSVVASENFRQGDIGGEGWGAYVDGEGHTVLEADTVVVRKDMRVNTLTVNQIAYLGGKQIISAAAMECNRVEAVTGGYKCYFDQKQGSIANLFKVNDVVLGQVWNADESEQRYYKRKVIAIDSDSITLSSDIADGTGVPQPKDIMVQYGSYTDTSRQYVIIRDVIGGGYERMLSGLTSVYTDGTEYYFAGRQSGSTPRWFVGDALGQYASYQNGVLNIAGRLAVTTQIDTGSGSYTALSDYLSNLQDQIDGNVQTWYASGVPTLNNYPANTWTTVEDKNNHIGDLYYDSATGKAYRFMYDGTNEVYLWTQIADEDIAAALALAQQNQTAIAGLQYLKAATNQGTLVQGGLVLTSMIQLGQTEQGVYKVYSGINGIMDTSALGNGIAAWYGGQMADKVADNTLTNYAKSLFRFDGSGYLASGNIRWDLNGNGQIPGISWSNGTITLSPDIYLQGGDRLTQIVDAVNRMYTQFAYDSHDNIVIAPTNAFYIPTDSPQYPIAGKVALYYDYDGFYSETPSGGVADVYKLTLMKGATSLGVFDPAGPADQMIDIATAFSGYATQSWVSANFNNYVLPTASASVLGGIKLGTGLSIDASGVVSVTGQTQGTVTRVDLGTTQYSPDASGVVGLPAYPTTLPASDVYAWAKASTKPTYALNEITGTGDLQAIEALSGTSGLLKKTAANTWSLDTNTYLTASNHAALTLKVGTITIGNNYNSLEAKTYTITAQNLTDTIGSTTYAAYNADGYVPTTRKVNGHALSSDVTVTKGDVGLGNVENTALSTWAGSSNITTLGTITTGTWHGTAIANNYLANSSVTINSKSVSLGGSVSLNLDDIGDGTTKTWSRIVFTDTAQTITGAKKLKNISLLNIPTSISSADVESGKVYLYSGTGSYSETPSGGGTATVYDLNYLKNGVLQSTYNLGTAAANLNVTIGWSDLTPDSTHQFVSQAEKDGWLPLTAGNTKALTGDLFFNATLGSKDIRWTNTSNVTARALSMGGDGHLHLGYDQITNSKNIYLSGTNLYLTFGTTSRQVVGTGTYFRPATNNDISLGTSTLKWKIVYATQFDGALALSNVTGADDLKAIEALTGTGFAKRTADNTWALTNDIEASSLKTSTESSPMFTYRQTPSVAVGDSITLTKIKGKTLVWNQMVRETASAPTAANGLTVTRTADGKSWIVNGTATADTSLYWFFTNSNISSQRIVGHTYLLRACPSGGSLTTYYVRDTSGGFSEIDVGNGAIVTQGVGSTSWYGRVEIKSGVVCNNLIFTPQIFDLTTVGTNSLAAEFEALFPLNYYAYNIGSLLSLTASGVETVGKNIWDEEWESGSYSSTTGAKGADGSRIRNKNYIRVQPSTNYYIKLPYSVGSYGVNLYFYDGGKNFLSYSQRYSNTIPVPTGAYYMNFSTQPQYGNTYNHDICINKSDASFNGQYEPYKSNVARLDITTLKVKSPNIWDEEWEVGGIDSVTGQNNSVTNTLRSINYYRCIPSTKYSKTTTNSVGTGYLNVFWYDANKNYISGSYGGGTAAFIEVTSPSNAAYFRISTSPTYGNVYQNDICINLSNPGYNGHYYPHGEFAPYADGMKSAGTAYDELRSKSTTRRMAKVDLGTLNWVYAGNDHFSTSDIIGLVAEPATNSIVPNALCTKYACVDYQTYNNTDKVFTIIWSASNYHGQIWLHDSTYTDAATFKAAMSGVELIYEQANPEDFELVTPLDLMIPSDALGTQRLLPENGSVPTTAPIEAEITYGANAGDVVENIETKIDRLTLDNIPDGSTRKLANYLPLAGGTLTGTLTAQSILPSATSTYDLGSSTSKWKDLYLAGNAAVGGTLSVTGTTTLGNTLTAQNIVPTSSSYSIGTSSNTWSRIYVNEVHSSEIFGGTEFGVYFNPSGNNYTPILYVDNDERTLYLGNATGLSCIEFNNRINSHILPYTNNAYDLGSNNAKWKNLRLSGSAYVGDLHLTEQQGRIVFYSDGVDFCIDNGQDYYPFIQAIKDQDDNWGLVIGDDNGENLFSNGVTLDANVAIWGNIKSDLIPDGVTARNLGGSASSAWGELHINDIYAYGDMQINGQLDAYVIAADTVQVDSALTIPTSSPSSPQSNLIYLYAGSGSYSENPIMAVSTSVPSGNPAAGEAFIYYDTTTHQLCVKESNGTTYKTTLTA